MPGRRAEGRDTERPLRTKGAGRTGRHLARGFTEFLRLPLAMSVGFIAAGFAVSILDARASGGPIRAAAEAIVPPGAASGLLTAAATSLLTVTSITFSVLLVAVQQSASALTAVVFEQFLRRRANQVYFGFFVGLTAFTFVVLGRARTKPAPVYGASLTLALILASLVVLLLLIHSTVSQMRPPTVVRSIHQLALRARKRELVVLTRSRTRPLGSSSRPVRAVRAADTGYVISIDFPRLARIARAVGPQAEVLVDGRLGGFVVFGDVVARIAGAEEDRDDWDAEVLAAFHLDEVQDVEAAAEYAVDQLENIAWANGSSALQSPYISTVAIRALRDLGARWLSVGERDLDAEAGERDSLPVVYPDEALQRLLDAFAALVVAAAESRQAQTCAELLLAFADLASRVRTERDRAAFGDALASVLPTVLLHTAVPRLWTALTELRSALERSGLDAGRVREVQALVADGRSGPAARKGAGASLRPDRAGAGH